MNDSLNDRLNDRAPFLDLIHFEDFAVGDRYAYGAHEMQREDMLAFARRFDPEPFHMDAEAAKAMGWPDLIASGPHVCAIWRRLSKDAFTAADAFVSPGWDEVRWRKPVLVGHVLSVLSEVAAARPLRSRPELGYLQFSNEIRNQHGEITTTMMTSWFVHRRGAA
ncbi:MAG: MaoC/PaaZ C-terminal domain-containing protein [Alphaproteobacteria bacterium]|jgi:acyl dehydratase|nr:MaoC/PaaZ C-terminal domain-containing protein [Alphaproteobacteria bacterium]|tara:strand:- start:189 stop:683 length:495 start_codon:yes stop_codon:yes gene_type:complete